MVKWVWTWMLLMLLSSPACAVRKSAARPVFKKVYVDAGTWQDPVALKAVEVFRRVVNDKADDDLFVSSPVRRALRVHLCVRPSLKAENFVIEIRKRDVHIYAADGRGVLYGLGKLLHSS